MQRMRNSAQSVLQEDSYSQEKEARKFQERKTSRSVQISGKGGHHIFAHANIDESGEYEDGLCEWTVYFLQKNHAPSCPLSSLSNLEISIGGRKGYFSSFQNDSYQIIVRVYTARSSGEKSFSLTVGDKVVVLGKVQGWPEGRSPESGDDEEFNGTLENALQFIRSGSLGSAELLMGCIVFKSSILRSERPEMIEERGMNWESFE